MENKEKRKEKLQRDKFHKNKEYLMKYLKKTRTRKLERKEENFCSMLARGLN